mgnify:FL=1
MLFLSGPYSYVKALVSPELPKDHVVEKKTMPARSQTGTAGSEPSRYAVVGSRTQGVAELEGGEEGSVSLSAP